MTDLQHGRNGSSKVCHRSQVVAAYRTDVEQIKDTVTAAALCMCVGESHGKSFEPTAFLAYEQNLLEEAGRPSDPIEQMLVKQLALVHHRIADLHVRAANATTPETVQIYNTAAARLLNEFRKLSLALREYRTPIHVKNVTVVKQQNVAAGDQRIALVAGENNARPTKNVNTEVASNRPTEALRHEKHKNFVPQPQTSRRRTAEPAFARPNDG